VINTFQSLANDAPNVAISALMYELAERNMATGQWAQERSLDAYMSKTLRIIRYNRFNLPIAQLVEGVPPDAVGLGFTFVDIVVEQWGIVALLTDVGMVTLVHPILQIAIERCALAIAELTERENCKVLMTGTQVLLGLSKASRDLLVNTGTPRDDRMTTALILAATTQLRALGAPRYDGDLYGGLMQPQQKADVLASDTTFQNSSNFARVRKLENAEIGIWMGVQWVEGNFLPIFRGEAATDTGAATATKAQATVADVGGSLATGNYKIATVARDVTSDYERKISQASANLAVSSSVTTGSITVSTPTSASYVYDVYMTQVGGAVLFKVASRIPASTTVVITTNPAGTEAVAPVAPASGVEVFVAWVFGKDAWTRVKLNELSLQSYITPAGASWSNPIAQGRKVGTKTAYKAGIQDNAFMVRLETVAGPSFSAFLPA
jgi:N4-gp56 family major capsid protein